MVFGLSQKTHRACKDSRLELPNTLPASRYDCKDLLDCCGKTYRSPDTHFIRLSTEPFHKQGCQYWENKHLANRPPVTVCFMQLSVKTGEGRPQI